MIDVECVEEMGEAVFRDATTSRGPTPPTTDVEFVVVMAIPAWDAMGYSTLVTSILSLFTIEIFL